jgi:cobalt-zinc-cadmium efflux system membrane fusion protein
MEGIASGAAQAIIENGQANIATSEGAEGKPVDQSAKQGGENLGQDGDAQADEKPHGSSEESEQAVALNAAQLKDFGIEVAIAGQGPIAATLERLAEIKFDGNRVVHVVPRVGGVVSQVDVSQGQNVSKDELLAVLDSRELAELKANYLADYARRDLARQTFERERGLWEKKISSEKDYLVAKTALAEADIASTASAQKLRALGLSQEYVESLTDSKEANLTSYEIRAPIAGAVIERHLSLGEAVSADKNIFVIADASAVWVDVTIYPQDMSAVRAGQNVRIDLGDNHPEQGKIAFVTPNISEETRTGVARVILDSADGHLKPGLFVKVSIETGEEQARIRLPKSAIQNFANGSAVFVKEGEKFEPRPVKLGRDNSQFVEIVSGLSAGETYVTQGAFTLKSLILKSQMGEGN